MADEPAGPLRDWNVQVSVIVLVRAETQAEADQAACNAVDDALRNSPFDVDRDNSSSFESEPLPDEHVDLTVTKQGRTR